MTRDPLAWLAGLTLFASAAGVLQLALGVRKLGSLADSPPLPAQDAPHVTVVIAARDEERNLEKALRSVLALDYTSFDVIVVDDRSTDRTGEILDRMASESERLSVLHLREIPRGWLGKNHALHVGAARAKGELILFTDADIVLDPTSLARAAAYLGRERLGHLTSWPDFVVPGWLAQLTAAFALMGLLALLQPWKAKDPSSRRHIGIGAFNLVDAQAYRSVGGHEPIALRPDDDLKLGKLLKSRGIRQDVLDGRGFIHVEWYRSLGEMTRGLRKNSFAIVNYNLLLSAGALVAVFLVDVWPTVALLVTSGAAFWLNAGIWAVGTVGCLAVGTKMGIRPWLAPVYPVAAAVMIYVMARSTGGTVWHGGIEWRGTRYPLEALRGNRI